MIGISTFNEGRCGGFNERVARSQRKKFLEVAEPRLREDARLERGSGNMPGPISNTYDTTSLAGDRQRQHTV